MDPTTSDDLEPDALVVAAREASSSETSNKAGLSVITTFVIVMVAGVGLLGILAYRKIKKEKEPKRDARMTDKAHSREKNTPDHYTVEELYYGTTKLGGQYDWGHSDLPETDFTPKDNHKPKGSSVESFQNMFREDSFTEKRETEREFIKNVFFPIAKKISEHEQAGSTGVKQLDYVIEEKPKKKSSSSSMVHQLSSKTSATVHKCSSKSSNNQPSAVVQKCSSKGSNIQLAKDPSTTHGETEVQCKCLVVCDEDGTNCTTDPLICDCSTSDGQFSVCRKRD